MNCAMTADEATTCDAFLGGRLMLRQPRRGHRAGHDAVLLAAATAARRGDRVIEFGAGVGTAALALAVRVGGLDLILVEIDPALARLARDNAAANHIGAEVVELDVSAPAAAFPPALSPSSADAVLMNPPFHDSRRHQPSPDGGRSLAHQAEAGDLAMWLRSARRVLRPGGRLTLIWRADGLAEVLAALEKGFGSLKVLPVHAAEDAAAIRILVTAVKGGRAPLVLLPALVLNGADGRPRGLTEQVLRGGRPLPGMAAERA
jgi:tRNA1(Val) A37 N6-methylase TrmN6